MHDNGELARHRGGGWLESVTLCQPDTPRLEAAPFPAARQHGYGRLEEEGPQSSIAALADAAGAVNLTRGITPGR